MERVSRWGVRRQPLVEHVAPTPGSFRAEESTAEAFGQKWFGCGAARRREQDPVGERDGILC